MRNAYFAVSALGLLAAGAFLFFLTVDGWKAGERGRLYYLMSGGAISYIALAIAGAFLLFQGS